MNPGIYRVIIGGDKGCVFFSVYKDEPDSYSPNLDGLAFDENKCTIGEIKLEPNVGTVRMLKASIVFLCQLFPQIKNVLFKDASLMNCYKNIKINLYDFYIAKYGKTWYESKFNAIPESDPYTYYNFLNEINVIMNSPIDKPWEEFYNKYILTNQVVNKHKDFLEIIYNNVNSLREFIINVHVSSDGKRRDCMIFDVWLSKLMIDVGRKKLQLNNRLFKIERKNIDDWNYNIRITET
jgi:hypothetical protein